MTVQEGIEHARKVARDKRADADWKWRHGRLKADDCIFCAEEHEQLAEWLGELEQYRALGTVEELKNQKHNLSVAYQVIEELKEKSKEAREKQVAKKPTHHTECHPINQTTVNFETVYQCRNCHSVVKAEWNFCTLCGQAIDWEEGGISD